MSLASPPWLLRIESAFLLALAIVLYSRNGGSWLLFIILILAPDLSALGYLAGNRVGALCYNAAHAFIVPAILILAGLAWSSSLAISVGLIWAAHIAADRVLDYGLKYSTGFKDTHLNRI
ncbi:MAG TPA: DUF4260 domain-containing protein [Thermomicrobiales bacterium]|nr:DUF4260 domain-containing protein [Thermomicrobiales bacterium]